MTTVYHWGEWVVSDDPVTGVISNNSLEFIHDETMDAIDLHYETYLRENPDADDLDFWEDDSPTYLIGDWVYDTVTQQYDAIHNGENGFAAIVAYDGFNCTQVIWSKWTRRGALCSPCFPGQVDLDSPGEFLAYDLPIEIYGSFADDNAKTQMEVNPPNTYEEETTE